MGTPDEYMAVAQITGTKMELGMWSDLVSALRTHLVGQSPDNRRRCSVRNRQADDSRGK